MPSSENQQHTFPTMPPTNSAGDYETRDYYANHDAPRPVPNQAPYLTPYLGLRARLTQVPLNRWTILLLLIVVRVFIAATSMDSDLGSARSKAMSACTTVESTGSAMASMPHYMARGVNELTASSVDKAVNGLMSMLGLSITAVKQIVIFIINLLTSTYMCLITLAVGGATKAALELVEEVTEFLNKTIKPIGEGIGDAVEGFASAVNDMGKTLKSIPFVGDKVPTIDIGDKISALDNLQIPASFTDDINALKDKIPDFKDVQGFVNGVISVPFDKIKELIDNKMETYSFNRSIMPIPQKEKLEFCAGNEGINGFFDGLIEFLNKAKTIFFGVVIAMAILVMAPMAWFEIHRYRSMQQRSRLVHNNAYDPMDVLYIGSRPFTATTGIKAASKIRGVRKQTAVRWAIAYATSPAALFVLTLGVAGLAACCGQLILLNQVKAKAPELSEEVGNFTGKIVFALNNASESWQIGTNEAIRGVNTDINEEVLGWVKDSTEAVNNTLNAFVDQTMKGLDTAFGGTVLYEPIKGVLDCLILLKVEGIQKGITWVADNAHVNFPQVPADTLSLKALAESTDSESDDEFLLNPSGKTANEITEVVDSVVRKFESGIKTEMTISGVLIGIWAFFAIAGVIWAFTRGLGPEGNRGEGSQQYPPMPDVSDSAERAGMCNDTDRAYATDRPDSVMKPTPDHDAFAPKTPSPPYRYPGVNPAAPYTLTRNAYPNFDSHNNDEKSGNGAQHATDVIEPTHLRASAYGQFDATTPYPDEKNPPPFRTTEFPSSYGR